jgi:hypothetical protein
MLAIVGSTIPTIVTVAVPDFEGSAADVAVIVTEGTAAVGGAV